MAVRFRTGGKVALDHLYTQADPRSYFQTLQALNYVIPQLAKPYFVQLMADVRGGLGSKVMTVVDLGCGYGINAALLRCDTSMDELYRRYGDVDPACSRATLVARDRALVRASQSGPSRFVGLDISADALGYGCDAGFLDAVICADLERDDPTPEQREHLGAADLVISTGCVGYVSERTLLRVATAGSRLPWMAHTVLRMYSYGAAVSALAAVGYETVRVEGLLRQRRFASSEEQTQVLDTLSALGVDPTDVETDGWMYAQLFVSRPRPGLG